MGDACAMSMRRARRPTPPVRNPRVGPAGKCLLDHLWAQGPGAFGFGIDEECDAAEGNPAHGQADREPGGAEPPNGDHTGCGQVRLAAACGKPPDRVFDRASAAGRTRGSVSWAVCSLRGGYQNGGLSGLYVGPAPDDLCPHCSLGVSTVQLAADRAGDGDHRVVTLRAVERRLIAAQPVGLEHVEVVLVRRIGARRTGNGEQHGGHGGHDCNQYPSHVGQLRWSSGAERPTLRHR